MHSNSDDNRENKKVTYACVSQTLVFQTWECIDINNGVSSRDVFYDDVNAKQVEAECLLKSDCQTPKLLGIWLKQRLFQFTVIHLHIHYSHITLMQEWTFK